MRINKEGYGIIIKASAAVVLLIVICAFLVPIAGFPLWVVWVLAGVLIILLFFIVRFFRDPARETLSDSRAVFAPADGTVVVIEEVFEREYFQDRRIMVSVFMSINNVHVNWFPVGGEVVYKKEHHGEYLVAWHPKSSEENERVSTVVDMGSEKVMFKQIAGYVARRIVNYAEVGQRVSQNDRLGFIKFGSRVDVYLPLDAEILVSLDQKVKGSQTVIAKV